MEFVSILQTFSKKHHTSFGLFFHSATASSSLIILFPSLQLVRGSTFFGTSFTSLNNRRLIRIQCILLLFLASFIRTGLLGTSSFHGEAEIVEHGVISDLFCFITGLWEPDIRRHCLGGGEMFLILKRLSKWRRSPKVVECQNGGKKMSEFYRTYLRTNKNWIRNPNPQ